MNNLFSSSIIFLFGIYGIKLFALNELGFYIHKKFIFFSLFGSCICFAVGAIGIAYFFLNAKKTFQYPNFLPLLPIIIALVCGFFLPVKPIVITAADANTITFTKSKEQKSTIPMPTKNDLIIGTFGKDTAKYSFEDWTHVYMMDNTFSFMNNKTVDLVGYYSKPANAPENIFYIERMMITCCTVDARSVGFAAESTLSENVYKSGEWIRVTGQFTLNTDVNAQEADKIFIDPTNIVKTKAPKDPYIYF